MTKNFLRWTKILAKTCCIKSTNSYNYQQVIAVFACFRSPLIDAKDLIRL
jgi:hypothetical protein